jgi:hypothetical protein
MTDRLQQLERQLQTANKRITDLETRYLALLEDLKMMRVEMARVSRGTIIPPPSNPADNLNTYRSVFDRWPGAER